MLNMATMSFDLHATMSVRNTIWKTIMLPIRNPCRSYNDMNTMLGGPLVICCYCFYSEKPAVINTGHYGLYEGLHLRNITRTNTSKTNLVCPTLTLVEAIMIWMPCCRSRVICCCFHSVETAVNNTGDYIRRATWKANNFNECITRVKGTISRP